MSNEREVAPPRHVQGSYSMASVLAGLEPPQSTWRHLQRTGVRDAEKYRHMRRA